MKRKIIPVFVFAFLLVLFTSCFSNEKVERSDSYCETRMADDESFFGDYYIESAVSKKCHIDCIDNDYSNIASNLFSRYLNNQIQLEDNYSKYSYSNKVLSIKKDTIEVLEGLFMVEYAYNNSFCFYESNGNIVLFNEYGVRETYIEERMTYKNFWLLLPYEDSQRIRGVLIQIGNIEDFSSLKNVSFLDVVFSKYNPNVRLKGSFVVSKLINNYVTYHETYETYSSKKNIIDLSNSTVLNITNSLIEFIEQGQEKNTYRFLLDETNDKFTSELYDYYLEFYIFYNEQEIQNVTVNVILDISSKSMHFDLPANPIVFSFVFVTYE